MGLEPTTFELEVQHASPLRHGDDVDVNLLFSLQRWNALRSLNFRLDCRIPGHKMANLKHCYRGAAVVYLKHCYRGAAVVLSRCALSPVVVKPCHKIAISKYCYCSTAVVVMRLS